MRRLPQAADNRLGDAVLLAELVYATAGVDDLLLARVERVAGGAHFDVEDAAKRRPRREFVSATADHLSVFVARVDVGFHG